MRKLGMTDAPPEATAAVFAYFDHDESGTVEYRKLHAIIKRSLQDRPVVPLLALQTANRITLRTKRVLKANANLLEGLDLDEAAMRSIPGQIKGAMQASLVRVVDLFRYYSASLTMMAGRPYAPYQLRRAWQGDGRARSGRAAYVSQALRLLR
jgi:hypothetical protein